MANLPVLPRAQAPANTGGAFTREWYDFFRAIRPLAADNEALQAEIDAILVRLQALEDAPVTEATINGLSSVQVLGSLESGLVQILLQGDSDSPGATFYYGTDAAGLKGWHPVADTVLAASGELSKSVSGTGVTTFGLASLTNINDGVFQLFYRDGKGRVSGTLPGSASDVPYDNSTSGLSATEVQAAIDEIASGGGQIFNRIDATGDIRVAADGSLRITN
jgi:hypothetical protein